MSFVLCRTSEICKCTFFNCSFFASDIFHGVEAKLCIQWNSVKTIRSRFMIDNFCCEKVTKKSDFSASSNDDCSRNTLMLAERNTEHRKKTMLFFALLLFFASVAYG